MEKLKIKLKSPPDDAPSIAEKIERLTAADRQLVLALVDRLIALETAERRQEPCPPPSIAGISGL